MKKRRAIEFFGGPSEVGRACQPAGGNILTRQAVDKWGVVVPLNHAIRLQFVSFGNCRVDLADYGLDDLGGEDATYELVLRKV